MQYQAYKKHFEKLLKHFYPKRNSLPTGNFDVKATVEKYFPEQLKKYSEENNDVIINSIEINSVAIANNQTNSNNPNSEETKVKRNATTKQQLTPRPTQQEVDGYLLENIFGCYLPVKNADKEASGKIPYYDVEIGDIVFLFENQTK